MRAIWKGTTIAESDDIVEVGVDRGNGKNRTLRPDDQ